MTYRHRRWHYLLWLILPPLVGLVFLLSLLDQQGGYP